MSTTAYKIRRKSDGLYSSGGIRPRFTTFGKVWGNRSSLGSHLALVETNRRPYYWYRRDTFELDPDPYADCEIVELVVEHRETETTTVQRWKDGIKERKLLREQTRAAYRAAQQ